MATGLENPYENAGIAEDDVSYVSMNGMDAPVKVANSEREEMAKAMGGTFQTEFYRDERGNEYFYNAEDGLSEQDWLARKVRAGIKLTKAGANERASNYIYTHKMYNLGDGGDAVFVREDEQDKFNAEAQKQGWNPNEVVTRRWNGVDFTGGNEALLDLRQKYATNGKLDDDILMAFGATEDQIMQGKEAMQKKVEAIQQKWRDQGEMGFVDNEEINRGLNTIGKVADDWYEKVDMYATTALNAITVDAWKTKGELADQYGGDDGKEKIKNWGWWDWTKAIVAGDLEWSDYGEHEKVWQNLHDIKTQQLLAADMTQNRGLTNSAEIGSGAIDIGAAALELMPSAILTATLTGATVGLGAPLATAAGAALYAAGNASDEYARQTADRMYLNPLTGKMEKVADGREGWLAVGHTAGTIATEWVVEKVGGKIGGKVLGIAGKPLKKLVTKALGKEMAAVVGLSRGVVSNWGSSGVVKRTMMKAAQAYHSLQSHSWGRVVSSGIRAATPSEIFGELTEEMISAGLEGGLNLRGEVDMEKRRIADASWQAAGEGVLEVLKNSPEFAATLALYNVGAGPLSLGTNHLMRAYGTKATMRAALEWSGQYTAEEVKAMSREDMRKNFERIYMKGGEEVGNAIKQQMLKKHDTAEGMIAELETVLGGEERSFSVSKRSDGEIVVSVKDETGTRAIIGETAVRDWAANQIAEFGANFGYGALLTSKQLGKVSNAIMFLTRDQQDNMLRLIRETGVTNATEVFGNSVEEVELMQQALALHYMSEASAFSNSPVGYLMGIQSRAMFDALHSENPELYREYHRYCNGISIESGRTGNSGRAPVFSTATFKEGGTVGPNNWTTWKKDGIQIQKSEKGLYYVCVNDSYARTAKKAFADVNKALEYANALHSKKSASDEHHALFVRQAEQMYDKLFNNGKPSGERNMIVLHNAYENREVYEMLKSQYESSNLSKTVSFEQFLSSNTALRLPASAGGGLCLFTDNIGTIAGLASAIKHEGMHSGINEIYDLSDKNSNGVKEFIDEFRLLATKINDVITVRDQFGRVLTKEQFDKLSESQKVVALDEALAYLCEVVAYKPNLMGKITNAVEALCGSNVDYSGLSTQYRMDHVRKIIAQAFSRVHDPRRAAALKMWHDKAGFAEAPVVELNLVADNDDKSTTLASKAEGEAKIAKKKKLRLKRDVEQRVSDTRAALNGRAPTPVDDGAVEERAPGGTSTTTSEAPKPAKQKQKKQKAKPTETAKPNEPQAEEALASESVQNEAPSPLTEEESAALYDEYEEVGPNGETVAVRRVADTAFSAHAKAAAQAEADAKAEAEANKAKPKIFLSPRFPEWNGGEVPRHPIVGRDTQGDVIFNRMPVLNKYSRFDGENSEEALADFYNAVKVVQNLIYKYNSPMYNGDPIEARAVREDISTFFGILTSLPDTAQKAAAILSLGQAYQGWLSDPQSVINPPKADLGVAEPRRKKPENEPTFPPQYARSGDEVVLGSAEQNKRSIRERTSEMLKQQGPQATGGSLPLNSSGATWDGSTIPPGTFTHSQALIRLEKLKQVHSPKAQKEIYKAIPAVIKLDSLSRTYAKNGNQEMADKLAKEVESFVAIVSSLPFSEDKVDAAVSLMVLRAANGLVDFSTLPTNNKETYQAAVAALVSASTSGQIPVEEAKAAIALEAVEAADVVLNAEDGAPETPAVTQAKKRVAVLTNAMNEMDSSEKKKSKRGRKKAAKATEPDKAQSADANADRAEPASAPAPEPTPAEEHEDAKEQFNDALKAEMPVETPTLPVAKAAAAVIKPVAQEAAKKNMTIAERRAERIANETAATVKGVVEKATSTIDAAKHSKKFPKDFFVIGNLTEGETKMLVVNIFLQQKYGSSHTTLTPSEAYALGEKSGLQQMALLSKAGSLVDAWKSIGIFDGKLNQDADFSFLLEEGNKLDGKAAKGEGAGAAVPSIAEEFSESFNLERPEPLPPPTGEGWKVPIDVKKYTNVRLTALWKRAPSEKRKELWHELSKRQQKYLRRTWKKAKEEWDKKTTEALTRGGLTVETINEESALAAEKIAAALSQGIIFNTKQIDAKKTLHAIKSHRVNGFGSIGRLGVYVPGASAKDVQKMVDGLLAKAVHGDSSEVVGLSRTESARVARADRELERNAATIRVVGNAVGGNNQYGRFTPTATMVQVAATLQQAADAPNDGSGLLSEYSKKQWKAFWGALPARYKGPLNEAMADGAKSFAGGRALPRIKGAHVKETMSIFCKLIVDNDPAIAKVAKAVKAAHDTFTEAKSTILYKDADSYIAGNKGKGVGTRNENTKRKNTSDMRNKFSNVFAASPSAFSRPSLAFAGSGDGRTETGFGLYGSVDGKIHVAEEYARTIFERGEAPVIHKMTFFGNRQEEGDTSHMLILHEVLSDDNRERLLNAVKDFRDSGYGIGQFLSNLSKRTDSRGHSFPERLTDESADMQDIYDYIENDASINGRDALALVRALSFRSLYAQRKKLLDTKSYGEGLYDRFIEKNGKRLDKSVPEEQVSTFADMQDGYRYDKANTTFDDNPNVYVDKLASIVLLQNGIDGILSGRMGAVASFSDGMDVLSFSDDNTSVLEQHRYNRETGQFDKWVYDSKVGDFVRSEEASDIVVDWPNDSRLQMKPAGKRKDFTEKQYAALDKKYFAALKRKDHDAAWKVLLAIADVRGYDTSKFLYRGEEMRGRTRMRSDAVWTNTSKELAYGYARPDKQQNGTLFEEDAVAEALDPKVVAAMRLYVDDEDKFPLERYANIIEMMKKNPEDYFSEDQASDLKRVGLWKNFRMLSDEEVTRAIRAKRATGDVKGADNLSLFKAGGIWIGSNGEFLRTKAIVDKINELLFDGGIVFKFVGRKVRDDDFDPYELDMKGAHWERISHKHAPELVGKSEGGIATDGVFDRAIAAGYTGVIMHNIEDANSENRIVGDNYVFSYPSHVKLWHLITYDDDGNIIPPSKRFDVWDDDIRFQTNRMGANNSGYLSYRAKVLEGIGAIRDAKGAAYDKIINYNGPLFRAVKSLLGGAAPSDDVNVEAAFKNAPGRVRNKVEGLHKKYLDPLMKLIKECGLDAERLDEYLYAKFAPERNKMIQSRTLIVDPNTGELEAINESGSGMSLDEANALLNRLSQEPNRRGYEDAMRLVWKMNGEVSEMAVKYGMVTKEQRDLWMKLSPHYVPLKDLDSSHFHLRNGGKGLGSLFRRAKGRDTKAASPLAASIWQAEELIKKGEDSESRKVLARLIQKHDADGKQMGGKVLDFSGHSKIIGRDAPMFIPNGSPAERLINDYNSRKNVSKYDQRINLIETPESMALGGKLVATGNVPETLRVRIVQSNQMKPNVVDFYENGVRRFIVFDRDNADAVKIADAINKATLRVPSKNGGFSGAWELTQKLTRWKADVSTSLNPRFVLRNMGADFFNTSMILMTEGKWRELGEFAKGYIKAFKTVRNFAKGKDVSGTEMGKYYLEAREQGMLTGVYGEGTFKDAAHKLSRDIKRIQGGSLRAGWEGFKEFMETIGSYPEQGARLAVYAAMRNNGMSPAIAAQYGREVSVDFNAKGEWTPIINTLYMFSNAGAQGVYRAIKAVKTGAEARGGGAQGYVRALLPGILVSTALGYISAVLMDSAGDDDDDEINNSKYERLPDHVKKNNIALPFFGDTYIQLPTRGMWQPFAHFGTLLYDYSTDRASSEEVVAGFTRSIAEAADFIGGGAPTGWQWAMPTAIDPFVQVLEGKDWTGRDLYQRDFGQAQSDASRGKTSTSNIYKAIANSLNYASGGDDVVGGALDIHPETYKLFSEFLLGSIGQLALTDIPNSVKSAFGAEDFNASELPIVGGVLREDSDMEALYYKNYSVFAEVSKEIQAYRKKRKEAKTPEERMSVERKIKAIEQRHPWAKSVNGLRKLSTKINDLRASASSTTDDRRKQALLAHKAELERRFIRLLQHGRAL